MTPTNDRRRLGAGLLRDPVHFLALGFGSGLAPVAPGTFGSVVGVLAALFVQRLPLLGELAVIVSAFLAGIWICGESARRLGVHDHPGIVWDEIVGMLVTMAFAPAGWAWLLGGFVLFRFFDILKPWPIRKLDHGMDGGLGIMLDDVLAGVYAGLLLFGAAML
jgi:phosphatidylglycerophosphatase A